MALSDRAYVRLPPDGAGKALVSDYMIYAEYISGSGGAFIVDDVVLGAVSGTVGKVVQSIPTTAQQGRIGIHLAFPNLANSFAVGERLIVDGVERATVSLLEDVHVSRSQVVGSNNPNFGQRVDAVGAASVRFTEGSPAFDAFGRLQTSEALMLGEYRTPYDLDPGRMSFVTAGGGTVVYETVSQGTILRVDTIAGSRASRTTNKYHAYQPGSSQLAQMSLSLSHGGQTGVRFRWGYYDDSDGLYFQQEDSTLSVVIRSSVGGTVEERVIDRSDWNGDPLDGTGDSGMVLDTAMLSLWWIDFGWYGANRARFGIYDAHGRITVHTEENGNKRPRAFLKTARLPLRWEVENVGASGSTSEMYLLSASVKAEGQIDRPVIAFGGSDTPTADITGDAWKVLYGCRAGVTYKDKVNRVFVLPRLFTLLARDPTTLAPASIKLAVIKGPDPVGLEQWIKPPSNPNTSLEFNPYSQNQTVTGGRILGVWMGTGAFEAHASDIFDYTNGETISLASDGTQVPYYICARPVDPTSTVRVSVATNWHEVQ